MSDVTLNPFNTNKGTDRGKYMLTKSIAEVGARRSVVADKDGVIIAGNKTVAAAKDAGIPLKIVAASPDELVVLQFDDLDIDGAGEDGEKARFYEIIDNRSSEVGLEWDAEMVQEVERQGVALLDMFNEGELANSFDIEYRETFDAPLAAFASQEQDIYSAQGQQESDVEGDREEANPPVSSGGDKQPSTSLARRHVVPIVLTGEQNEKWREFKNHNGIKDDLKAFLYLLDLYSEPFDGVK